MNTYVETYTRRIRQMVKEANIPVGRAWRETIEELKENLEDAIKHGEEARAKRFQEKLEGAELARSMYKD